MSCNTHSFNVGLAKKYGFGCAVLLQHFYFWTEKNRHDKDMVAGGFVWFYTSRRQMMETFPYLSDQNIRTCISKMLEAHLIMIGEDVIKAPCNTNVYALAPLGLSYFEDVEDQLVKSTNQLVETTNPNKDSKKDSNLSIEEKRRILAERCEPFVAQYGRQMIDAFVSYWGEANGNRLRCEIAKQKSGAFEISRRLATWASKEYNQPRKPVTPASAPSGRPIWESLGMTREQYLKMQGK